MEIVKMQLSELNPAAYNPRKSLRPGDPVYEKLKASMLSFGNVEPIVWNRTTGNVVGGHQRLRVLLDLGITETEVSVVRMSIPLVLMTRNWRPSLPMCQRQPLTMTSSTSPPPWKKPPLWSGAMFGRLGGIAWCAGTPHLRKMWPCSWMAKRQTSS